MTKCHSVVSKHERRKGNEDTEKEERKKRDGYKASQSQRVFIDLIQSEPLPGSSSVLLVSPADVSVHI